MDMDAFTVTAWDLTFFSQAHDVVVRIDGPILSKLYSASMLCLQRQLCSVSEAVLKEAVAEMTMSTISQILDIWDGVGSHRHLFEQMRLTAGKLNVIAIVGSCLLWGLKRKDAQLENTLRLHIAQVEFAKAAFRFAWPEIAHLKNTGVRIWHDTLKALLAFEARRDVELIEMKRKAFTAWRDYGALFGWRAGIRVMSFVGKPSKLSSELRYWKVPKQCFSNACACSGHLAIHRLRVCQGCWRALYCSQHCQRRVWPLIRRLLIRTFGQQRLGSGSPSRL